MKRVLAKRKPHKHHTGGYNGSGGGYGYGPRAVANHNIGRHYGVRWRVTKIVGAAYDRKGRPRSAEIRAEPFRSSVKPHQGDRERARRLRQMDRCQLTGIGVLPPLGSILF